MGLVELVLFACLIKEPDRCETFRVPFLDRMSIVQCAFQSQFRAAEWAGEHPAWQIRRFSCQAPSA
jgi:hypothetical protein